MATAAAEDWLALLDRLADGAWHSGERLAHDAGVSRAALAKRIDRLREQGVQVEARHGLGYRLATPLQRLDAQALSAAVPGMAVRVLPVVDSTNRQLAEHAATGDPQALFAERQTAGRGRRGRSWISPFGANICLSIAWSFPAWPPRLSTLPLAVGVACCRVVADAGIADVRLKWPNDLIVSGRKLGGILIEQRGEAAGSCRVIVGIGINVAMHAAQADAIDQPWTALHALQQAAGRDPTPRGTFAAALLAAQARALATFAQDGFASFAEDWQRFDLLRGRPIRVQGPSGELLDALALGIDEHGALQVEHDGQRSSVHAGDVSVRERPR